MLDTIKDYENEMEKTFGCTDFNPEKKNIVIYSNCHGALIHKILSHQDEIVSKYNIFVLLCYIYANHEDLTKFMDKIQTADIFIYQIIYPKCQRISTYHENPNCLLNHLNEKCVRISIPNVQCSLFYLHRLPSLTEFVKSNGILNIIEPDNTKKLLEFSINVFNQSMEILKKKEEMTDIKIFDYLQNNLETKRLFIDKLHPCNDVIFEITQRLCAYCNLSSEITNPFSYNENPLAFEGKSLMSGIEMKVINCNYISDEEIYHGNILLQQRIDDINGNDNFGIEFNKIQQQLRLWED